MNIYDVIRSAACDLDSDGTSKCLNCYLKLNKAVGMDGIHTNIQKELSEEISLPLCMIFRKSLDEGVVPPDWRAADVVPLYKKGAKNHPSNYLPVSLISVVYKILEILII